MDTVQHTSQADDHAPVASFASGLVAAAATLWIWALSASTTFDPPEWTRILGSWLLPIGLVCAVTCRFIAARLRTPRCFSVSSDSAGFCAPGMAAVRP